jgi:hypothetical protein
MAEVIRPYVTVRSAGDTHTPVLMMANREGHVQVADHRAGEDDPVAAKRVAVSWANEMNVEYRRPDGNA